MYTKEEAKKIRMDFWSQFKSRSARLRQKAGKKGRWMMNDTGMRQVRLKFHFDEHMALVAIEVDTRNMDKRIDLWTKLESLAKRLDEAAPFDLTWDMEYWLSPKKSVSRIYAKLDQVSIYNKEDWKNVNEFFYSRMSVLEDFFTEYRDYLRS